MSTVLDKRRTKENLRATSGFPIDRRRYTTCHNDDSDLEEDDDDDELAGVPQAVTEKPRDNDAVVLDKSDAKSNQSSDIVSVSDLDSLFYESSYAKGETDHPLTLARLSSPRMWPSSRMSLSHLLASALRLRATNSRRCFGTCTRTGLSSRHGVLWKDTKPVLLRRYRNRTESQNPSPKSVYRLADKVMSSHVPPANSD